MQCPYERRTGTAREYPIFFKSYGARGGPVRHRYGHVWELTQPEFASYMAVRGPYRPLTAPARAVHGMRMIFKPVRGPQAYDANCTGPYGEATFVRRRTVPVSGRTMFVLNSPGTAHTVPGNVMWLRHHITLPGPVRAVHGLFWTKIVRPLTGPARALCGAVRILPLRTGPVEF